MVIRRTFRLGEVSDKGVFSPRMYSNLYSEYIMRQANLEELDIGVRMGRKINNLRYADDTTLLAESKEELLTAGNKCKREECSQAGLYLNLKKTKVMSTEEIDEFEVDGEKVGVVRDFVFLGAKIEDSGSCKGDIFRRLALGRAAMTGLNKTTAKQDMSTEEIDEFEVDGEKVGVVRDFVFLGAKIEDSGSCKGDIFRRLALGRAAMTGLNKIWKDKDITITTKC